MSSSVSGSFILRQAFYVLGNAGSRIAREEQVVLEPVRGEELNDETAGRDGWFDRSEITPAVSHCLSSSVLSQRYFSNSCIILSLYH
jgi:hypothetical protein